MKSIVAGFIAGLFLLGASPAPVATSSPDVTRATLDNGLKVVIVRNRLAPVVSLSMTYGVGGDDDTIPGIAHATEHMMFRGTNDVSSDQFAAIATRSGAQYNASTTNEFTQFYFTLPSSYVNVALHLEADRMTNLAIGADEWKNERGAIEQEVQAHVSSPLFKVSSRITQLMFGDTPYAHDALGTIAGFDKMTAPDIASFYHAWYHPNNATLVIVGDVDPATLLASVHHEFDPIASAALPKHPAITIAPLPTAAIDDTVDFPVPLVGVAYRLPGSDDADFATAQVMNEALNNGRGALTALTLSGKVLGAASVQQAYPEVGFGFLVAIARPGSDPQVALADLKGAIADYQRDGVPSELIEAAKTRLLASHDYESASIPGQREAWSSSLELNRQSPAQFYDAIASVTPNDVNRLLRSSVVDSHEIQLVLHSKPGSAAPRADAGSQGENVTVIAKENVALPAWTQPYFSAHLVAPRADDLAKTVRLPNGITVAVRREAFSPVVVLSASIHSSPELYEPIGKAGVAAVTEALLTYGTTTYDFKAYRAELDAIAASVTLGTDFSMTSRSTDFDRAVQLLANGERSPAFDPAMFALVKKNTVSALAALAKEPETVASIARTDAVYPVGDPRRRRATAQTMSSLTLEDVRNWYKSAYRPDLMVMAIVGDISPDVAIATVKKYFGDWHAVGPKPDFKFPTLPTSKHSSSVTVSSPTNTQSQVSLSEAIGVSRYSRDAVALRVADTILSGEGTGSLLFRDVRSQHGLVYSIDSNVDFGQDASLFGIDFSSDAKNVDRAQASAIADIQKMRTVLLPLSDIERAKAVLLSNDLLPLASYDGLSGSLLEALENGIDANEVDRYYVTMLAITPEDVRAAMHRWINPTRFARVIVAPGKS